MSSRARMKQVEKMVTKTVTIRCPHCGSEQVSQNGHNKAGKQRYLCNNPEWAHRSFVEEYTNKAWDPKVREQVLKLAIVAPGHGQQDEYWVLQKIPSLPS